MEVDLEENIQYKIGMNTEAFKDLVETAENEWFVNNKGEKKLRSRKLRGTWVNSFKKLVNEYEKEEFKMLGIIRIIIFYGIKKIF